MPPRPRDSDEFDAAMAAIAEQLAATGHESMAERVSRAQADMRDVGYGAGRGAEQTRARLQQSLRDLLSRPEMQLVKDDLVAAVRWIPMAGEVAREVSAKRHLRRHPSRDIAER
jgi:hypothetical protein